MGLYISALPPQLHQRVFVAYGCFAIPLAFFALPVYVHVPNLYAGYLGVPLSQVGYILLAARLFDAVLDPLIGRWSDVLQQRKWLLLLALPLLVSGWCALFLPPEGAGGIWLGLSLLIAYLGYSLASINYQAWGVEFAVDHLERTHAVAWREGCGLLGVILAAALPSVFAPTLPEGLARLTWLFLPMLFTALAVALWCVPRYPKYRVHQPDQSNQADKSLPPKEPLTRPWRNRVFRALLGVYALNGIAAAMPAALVLFYINDVLHAEAWSGAFLAVYFLAGAAVLPAWVKLAARYGRARTWLGAMLAVLPAFAVTPFLGGGDVVAFFLVCFLTGAALGADIALPPALLAEYTTRYGQVGASFGWWTSVTKLNLALAAGMALPLVAAFGYQPGQDALVNSHSATHALAIVYGGLPLLLKLLAAGLLFKCRHTLSDLEKRN